jgi:hypothetical protein
LESFVGFKRPEYIGDFTAAMRNCQGLLEGSGYDGDGDQLRQHLTRFTHAYSHDDSPDTTSAVSPEEVETAMRSVFIFMDALDPTHFAGLCSIADVDRSELLS